MKNKISIIVPIYNMEPYLEKCIVSISSQTYRNIEIILVDDGSTDYSSQICDSYEEKDARIKVIHKTNGGLSDARNAGMKVATGDFYMFIDSDDWIDDNMAEELLAFSLANNADLVISTISNENEFRKEIQYLPWSTDKKFTGQDIINDLLPHFVSMIDSQGNPIKPISGSVCRCLYNAELLKRHQIFFNVAVGSGQDKEFNLRVLTKCSCIYTTNNCYYHYNRSLVHGGSSTQRYAQGLYHKVKYRQECYKKTLDDAGLLVMFKKPLDFIWISTVLGVVKNLCYPGTPYSLTQIIEQAHIIIDDSDFFKTVEKFTSEQLERIDKNNIKLIRRQLPYFIVKTRIIIQLKKYLVQIRSLVCK